MLSRRISRFLIGISTVVVLGGCSLSGVKFTNVSDTWLNVWFYEGSTPAVPTGDPQMLVRRKSIQVQPGGSATYRPREVLVHVQVETVTPTWVPTGRDYWLELLTRPPVHVVASGRADRLEFKSFDGEIAIIPERERGDRFTHLLVAPEPPPSPMPPPAGPPAVTGAPDAGRVWDE